MTWRLPVVLLAVVAAGACTEDLTIPGGCPALCPGGQPQVRDTILFATPDSDSSFFGFQGWSNLSSLLASDALEAGEARAWYRFTRRPDSVFAGGEERPYTVDSVAILFVVIARDTAVRDLQLFLHQIPRVVAQDLDSLSTFDTVEAFLTEATLVDSVAVDDTLALGGVRHVLEGEVLERWLQEEADSGYATLGIRMRAAAPSGVRLGALFSASAAFITTYVTADIADTNQQRQQITTLTEANGYVLREPDPPADPDLLYIGRLPAARTIMRFTLPPIFFDERLQLVRATLELTPAEPILGLPNDNAGLEVRGLVRDLGAKSMPTFQLRALSVLPVGSDDRVAVELLDIVNAWRVPDGLPSSLLVSLSPEGGSFHRPVFHSTRSGAGVPRIRLTYVLPFPVENP